MTTLTRKKKAKSAKSGIAASGVDNIIETNRRIKKLLDKGMDPDDVKDVKFVKFNLRNSRK